VIVVSSASLPMCASTSPLLSLQARHFSTIHAARPTGESVSPYPSVCGRVDWMAL
jgi:hypothetical protein